MTCCPNCKHENPQGATNCEACYTALPAVESCPACGASVQLEATFCGQCGHDLKSLDSKLPILLPPPASSAPELANIGLPPTVLTIPAADIVEIADISAPAVETVQTTESNQNESSQQILEQPAPLTVESDPILIVPQQLVETVEIAASAVGTTLQPSGHHLLHLQTNTRIEIPPQLSVIHLGKPNDQIVPDIDVSGFPCAEVVSRIHANIRLEEENYYIEDVGSANGTYINHNILTKGNRHLLRSGDRIGLGKGDLVTFIFQ